MAGAARACHGRHDATDLRDGALRLFGPGQTAARGIQDAKIGPAGSSLAVQLRLLWMENRHSPWVLQVAAVRPSLPIDETACGLESRRHTGDFYLVARLTKRAIATPQERSVAPRFGPSMGASHDPLRCRGPKNRMALRPPITSGSSRFVGIPPSTKIGSQTYTRDGPLQGGAGGTGGHRVGRR